jgi:hypothetical protein
MSHPPTDWAFVRAYMPVTVVSTPMDQQTGWGSPHRVGLAGWLGCCCRARVCVVCVLDCISMELCVLNSLVQYWRWLRVACLQLEVDLLDLLEL